MREVAWVVFDEIHYMRDKGGCGEIGVDLLIRIVIMIIFVMIMLVYWDMI